MDCHIYQLEHEPFWSFFLRYETFFLRTRNVEKWQICHHLYRGLNVETRELVDEYHDDMLFFDHTPMTCLTFFYCLAKHFYRKEYPCFPLLEIPPTYPSIEEESELESMWSVNTFRRVFEVSLGYHYHDLDSPHPIISSPPSLDDHCSCVDAPPTDEVHDEVPCAPQYDTPLTYVHDHLASGTNDLEVDLPVIEESQVHTLVVPSVESHPTPLCHEKLPVVMVHAHFDPCVAMPLVSLPPPFMHSSPGFSSCHGKSVFVVFLPFFFLLSLFHSPTSAVVGSEYDKLLRSLTRYHVVSRV
jgi:hypothetical protein